MHDPRLDEIRRLAEGVPYPPTHPKGPRAMQDVVRCTTTRESQGCGHPVDWHTGPDGPNPSCSCCGWRKEDPLEPAVVRTPPPPGFPPEKWEIMSRRERRAAMKGRKRAR